MVPGAFNAAGVPVRFVVSRAFNVQDFQITGGPDWMNTDRFDIEARLAPDTAGPQNMAAALRAMLADRFQMVATRETREMPVLVLVRAREDGQLGPQMKPSPTDCAAAEKGGTPGPLQADGRPACGGRGGLGRITAGGLRMTQLAQQLSQFMGRIVIDKTGLDGFYQFDLSWAPTPEQMPPGMPPGAAPPFDPNAPILPTALQEQLGLKLESGRGPVEVIVIERLEPPSEN
jgi:uncharacterized protein (TIGR03435 family)